MLFWKRSIKNLKSIDYYDSIDTLPINNWIKIHKTNDYRFLIINKEVINNGLIIKLRSVWDDLYNDFIKRFGFSDEFIEHLNRIKKIADLQASYIISGKKHFKTLIAIEKEIDKKNKNENELELEVTLSKISKFYGFKISSNNLTVSEYYSYIKNIKNGG